jgi:hypothetical protein
VTDSPPSTIPPGPFAIPRLLTLDDLLSVVPLVASVREDDEMDETRRLRWLNGALGSTLRNVLEAEPIVRAGDAAAIQWAVVRRYLAADAVMRLGDEDYAWLVGVASEAVR